MFELKLPSLGDDGGDEAVVSLWYCEKGDQVHSGDDVVEMTTDKATFNVSSPKTAIIAEIMADEGDTVEVGEVLAILEEG